MGKRMGSLVAALVASASLAACAPAMNGSEEVAQRNAETTLVVQNNNWTDMTVYVLRDGARARIGSVTGLSQGRFRLSDALVGGAGDVRILADPLGAGERFVSHPLIIMPGQEVRLRLENNIALSSYSVW